MDERIRKLIDAARAVQGTFPLTKDLDAGSVGAAVRSASGKIYTGINMDLACGIGSCAEHAAIAEMLKQRETEIEAVVAVDRERILPPCGRCRELMALVSERNLACAVVVGPDEVVTLRELLPRHWLFDSGKV